MDDCRRLALIALILGSVVGCGHGTFALLGLSSDDSGDDATTSIALLGVDQARTPPTPARLEFRLRNAESRPTSVRILVADPLSGNFQDALLRGGSLNGLQTSPEGIVHQREWDYATQFAGLFEEQGYLSGFRLKIAAIGGPDETPPIDLALGNDPPSLSNLQVILPDGLDEVGAIAQMLFDVRDSSGDEVKIRVEYQVLGGPDGPHLTLPSGDEDGIPPEYAIQFLLASSEGVQGDYFWGVAQQEGSREFDALVHFTPVDEHGASGETSSIEFPVDNNQAPIAVLEYDRFLVNPDRRRGIPIPFQVVDAEGDPVTVFFQWRQEREPFIDLPLSDLPSLFALLADPVARSEHHIASRDVPRVIDGRPVAAPPLHPPDPDLEARRLRLPELATTASHLLASDLVGQELLILRANRIPEFDVPVTALNTPIATLPRGEGTTAWVLDSHVTSSWRLREIELATGDVTSDSMTVTSSGHPSALCEATDGSLLIASDDGQANAFWKIQRVLLTDPPVVVDLIDASVGTTEFGRVRGLLSTSEHSVLMTLGQSLIRVRFPPGEPATAVTLYGPGAPGPLLQEPWGLASAETHPQNLVYVAENGADRISLLDLHTLERKPLVANGLGIHSPQGLAFDEDHAHLLVITDDSSQPGLELRGLPVGGEDKDDNGDGRSDSEVYQILGNLGGNNATVATGAHSLRIVALSESDRILVGGGLEQTRRIEEADAASQVVTVDRAFTGNPTSSKRWSVRAVDQALDGSPQGSSHLFLWDSTRDVISGGKVVLRMIPIDSEVGVSSEGSVGKEILPPQVTAPLTPDPAGLLDSPLGLDVADLDGDGDSDLICANKNSDNLTIFFQNRPREYGSPISLTHTDMLGPRAVVAADFDGDSRLDVACANDVSDNLFLFFQGNPGEFGNPTPIEHVDIEDPYSVAAADLDADGDMDLVCANRASDKVTIFFQDGPGDFSGLALTLSAQGLLGPNHVAPADVNGDGALDLLVSYDLSNHIALYVQSAPGTFDPPSFFTDVSMVAPVSVLAADLNRDGLMDIASANRDSDNITLYHQSTDGSFDNDVIELRDEGLIDWPRSIAAIDLLGDGFPDLLTANFLSSNITVYPQDPTRGFGDGAFELRKEGPGSGPVDVKAEDVDGDGMADIAFADIGTNDLTVFLQSTRGEIDENVVELRDSSTMETPWALASADFDIDGLIDVVSSNVTSDNLTIFFQSGPGVFEGTALPVRDDGGELIPWDVEAADLNGDGLPDLVSANVSRNDLTVFFQTEPGTFSDQALSLGNASTLAPYGVLPVDLNGDAALDLVSANFGSHSLTVFSQTTPGQFDKGDLVLDAGDDLRAPRGVCAADLDENGTLDLVCTSSGTTALIVFSQSESGEFTSSILRDDTHLTSPWAVTTADLDGDGALDVISANSGNVTAFLQTSAGGFENAVQLYSAPEGTRAVAAMDIDGDGDIDIATAHVEGGLRLFRQIRPGVFEDSGRTFLDDPLNDALNNVLVVDLDQDGDPDLVGSNSNVNSLMIFFGQH